jgi:4-amino-4-deoxy-L-arabinose transferase-like glycosyltransferase
MLTDIVISSNRKFICVTLVVLLISRACFQFYAAPLPDEAYYWLRGIHLSLSYYDHPPLQAWLQGLAASVFGWNLLSLRFLTCPTTIGIIAILFCWRKRLATPVWGAYFLATTAICFASPLIFIFTALAVNDHILIFLSFLSASFFILFLTEFSDRGQQSLLYLYLAAIFLAFAALTKYAVFLGLGAATSIVALPTLRPLLRSPHIYAAAALIVLIQLPVLYWNAANDLSSLRYNLWDRLHLQSWWVDLSTLTAVFATSVALLSPFLFAPLLGYLKSRSKGLPGTIWQSLGFWTFFYSAMTFSVLRFFTYVHFYWNIEAYLLFFPTALMYLPSSRVLRAHLAYGMICSILFTFNYTVLPLAAIVSHADF